jgi:hypothetical protein
MIRRIRKWDQHVVNAPRLVARPTQGGRDVDDSRIGRLAEERERRNSHEVRSCGGYQFGFSVFSPWVVWCGDVGSLGVIETGEAQATVCSDLTRTLTCPRRYNLRKLRKLTHR